MTGLGAAEYVAVDRDFRMSAAEDGKGAHFAQRGRAARFRVFEDAHFISVSHERGEKLACGGASIGVIGGDIGRHLVQWSVDHDDLDPFGGGSGYGPGKRRGAARCDHERLHPLPDHRIDHRDLRRDVGLRYGGLHDNFRPGVLSGGDRALFGGAPKRGLALEEHTDLHAAEERDGGK